MTNGTYPIERALAAALAKVAVSTFYPSLFNLQRFVKHDAHRSPSSNLLGEHALYAGIAHHSRLNDSGSNNKGFGLIPQN